MKENRFSFHLPTKIIFGIGTIEQLGMEMGGRKSALIVTDRGIREAGVVTRIGESLESCEIDHETYDGVEPNPTSEVIEAALPLAQKHEVIIAVGGGSSIDTAKVLNVLKVYGGKVLDWEGNDTIPGPCGHLIAVPTTAGTGSEVTFIAQISIRQRKQKLPIVSRYLAPDVAIVDPELTRALPPIVTAATGMDAMTHAIESLITIAEQPLADLLALQAIDLINRFLLRAVIDGNDIEARSNMAFASLIAGIAFSNGWVALAHSIAHALGGLFNLPHGLCCALALPVTMEYNLEVKRAKYARIAEMLGQPNAEAGISRIRELNDKIGLPKGLRKLGVKENDIGKITTLAIADGSTLFNPREATEEAMMELVRKMM